MSATSAPPTPVSVSDTVVAAFARDGFVTTSRVYTPDEVAAMRSTVHAAVAARQAGTVDVGDRHIGPTSDRYTEQFVQCLNLWEDNATVEDIVRDERLAATAAALLGGAQAVRVFQDQALFKPPGAAPTYAHQDVAYWPMATAECVTAWIPLSPHGSTRASGAMGYVPGSHRAGVCSFQDIAHVSDTEVLEANEHALLHRSEWGDDAGVAYVETDVGSVVWHHGLTVHRALGNVSNTPREVYTVVYVKDGVARGSVLSGRSNVPHFVTDGPDDAVVTVGAPLASRRMPVVYRHPGPGPRTNHARL